MLELPETLRTEISTYLQTILVAPQVGASIMQIVGALNGLKAVEVPEEPAKEISDAIPA